VKGRVASSDQEPRFAGTYGLRLTYDPPVVGPTPGALSRPARTSR
jgi:hypothetical protein